MDVDPIELLMENSLDDTNDTEGDEDGTFVEFIASSNEWNAKRDSIAMTMWQPYQSP